MYQKGKVGKIMIKTMGFKKTDVIELKFGKSSLPRGKARERENKVVHSSE